MKFLHRSLAAGALLLFAAACSTDSPMGVDSGVEIAPVTSFAPGALTVDLCKSWLDSEDPPHAENGLARFPFTYTDGAQPQEGEIELELFASAGQWVGPCATLTYPGGTGYSADTDLTITELLPPGVGVGRLWILYRNGNVDKVCIPAYAGDCTPFPGTEPNIVDYIPPTVTVRVGDVAQVLFKNVTAEVLPLEIAKTADASYDRTVTWELDKSVSPSSHMGGPGDSFDSDWTVTATKSESFGNYQVTGVITVTNPNPFAVDFSLTDELSDGTAGDISCPDTGDNTGTVPANGSIDCDYTASPDDASADENTATVTSDLGEESTTEGFTWTENVIGDDEVTLSDPRFTFSELISSSTIEIFPETFTCPTDLTLYVDGVYSFEEINTAYLNGDNTDLEASAKVTVLCEAPPEGCTLTPGYWKTHSSYGPAPYDATWAAIGEDTPFFLSGQSWYQAINTAPAGNAYYILSHAYIASALNFEAGASAPAEVSDAFAAATVLFETYTPAQIAALRGNDATRAEFVRLAGILDDYNNGITGPGHCG